ncbi:DoxX family protein [Dechloromonas sp. A34]|uniref:DoxX family protein n=1 Tax=Dechloromonas sp. A34 TaxID=447588 RepID=UPI0022489B91|nr:DoxX family protein [Dechloromonas sp. A34]
MNSPVAGLSATPASPLAGWLSGLNTLLSRIPDTFIALIGRFSIAAIFWKSGQTKIEGIAVDLVAGEFQFGWPQLSDSALELFRSEYRLPLLPPELAAPLAAFGEHLFPLLILIGLATRFSALALLVMTLTIQIFVYPDAYPTHGVWATVLLLLIARGAGAISLDHWLFRRYAGN